MVAATTIHPVGFPRSGESMPVTVAIALVIEEAVALWRDLEHTSPRADASRDFHDLQRAHMIRLVKAVDSCLTVLGDPSIHHRPGVARPPVELLAQPRAVDCGLTLTPRELEVLRLLAEGQTDREVSMVLHVSSRTVTTHVTAIFNKLGVGTRTAAVARAIRGGLV
jgi:DNA-binding CsgD family transcriptional regulator